MIPDGSYTAVVDRIEDGLATLEVDGEDELYELVVDAEELPDDGRHQDAILQIDVEADELIEAAYDESATVERTEDAQSRFDRLSERPSDSE